MHMKIGAIVYAESKESAKVEAERVFNDLCESVFDYFTILQGPIKANSKTGEGEINTLHGYTRSNFIEAYHNLIKELMGKTPDELFEQRNGSITFVNAKHWAYCMGQYRGHEIHLYDNDGEGIRDTRHLKNALNKWKCLFEDANKKNPYADMTAWLITADVHH